jgi:hypothetical protein
MAAIWAPCCIVRYLTLKLRLCGLFRRAMAAASHLATSLSITWRRTLADGCQGGSSPTPFTAATLIELPSRKPSNTRAGISRSRRLGYRIGRPDVANAACRNCGRLRVRYPDGEWVCYGCPSTSAVDLEVGRTPYAEGSRGGKQWTDAEIDLALSLNETHTFEQIGELVNRSGNAVRGLYDSLGVEKKYAMGKRLGE